MSGRRGFGGMSADVKAALLGAARDAGAPPEKTKRGAAQKARRSRQNPAFRDLPEYSELKAHRALGDVLGIDNPFFRVHEGRTGAMTVVDGRTILNFASYDYCGLNGRAEIADAAAAAARRYGVSASASRLVAGERDVHRTLERRLAEFTGVQDAAVFVSGHATNVGLIGLLMRPADLIVHDQLIHNSVLVGAKLSGAARRAFAHNDLDQLDAILEEARARHDRAIIVVEGHYSMDGDTIDLARLVEIKQRHGAWLMVDEAHSIGVLGKTGRGIAEHCGVDPAIVDIWMGTLSKTLSGCGGYVAGDAALIEYLKLAMPGFVYSVGLPPPIAAASLAALEVLAAEPALVARVNANARLFADLAREAGLDCGSSEGHAIVPVMTGDSARAVVLANRLLADGVNALPIIYPAVPERAARLRFFLSAEHDEAQIREAVAKTAAAHAALKDVDLRVKAASAVARTVRGQNAPRQ